MPSMRGSASGSLNDTCAIAVMAKAPQAGRSKTRLLPRLQPDAAAALSAAFLRDITENIALAGRAAAIHGWIAYAPADARACFDGHVAEGTDFTLADGAIDVPADVTGFGRALLHATTDLFARGYGAVCVLNSDSPTLPTARLVAAAHALLAAGDRAVLGAAEDGGYYLLGMKQAHARLFADIAWSTESVADATRARAAEIGLPVTELGTWYDVDEPAMLDRLAAELARGRERPGYAAPATEACLARMELLATSLSC
jgi:rSAM/selenodomain-associated transferase 1